MQPEQTVANRDDYIAMLVHDIRAPLSVIKGAADILIHERENLNQENVAKLLHQISITSDEVLRLVNDILDVSKIEAGKFEIEKTPSDLNLLLQAEVDEFLAVADKGGVKLEARTDTNVQKVNIDVEKMKRVLNNLISNALKFTPTQGLIVVSSKKEDNNVKVSVSDTGTGIPDDVKGRLFHKFVQAGGLAKSDTKGTGLGLVIVKEIVEKHGGNIWIENNTPQGSVFVFTIPIS